MSIRTDLALESSMDAEDSLDIGFKRTESENETTKTTVIDIINERGEKELGKPKGRYITVEVPSFAKDGEVDDDRLDAIANALSEMIPKVGSVLVVGLGNRDITADALGPLALNQILATRHLDEQLTREIGLGDLRPVGGIVPGVLGQTGIEVSDVVGSIVALIHPVAVVTIDALAARELERLGCTVQITDSGVSPGSGIGNARPQINQETLGVPVISIGVPTVIAAPALSLDVEMIMTPKDIDVLVRRAAKLVSLSLNTVLFPSLNRQEIIGLID